MSGDYMGLGPNVSQPIGVDLAKCDIDGNGLTWNEVSVCIVRVFFTHTAGSDTIFVQIYMDPPPGVPGVSKNQIFFFHK